MSNRHFAARAGDKMSELPVLDKCGAVVKLRRRGAFLAGIAMLAGSLVVAAPRRAPSRPGTPGRTGRWAASRRRTGDGFWVTYADGAVASAGTAHDFGDSSNLHLERARCRVARAPEAVTGTGSSAGTAASSRTAARTSTAAWAATHLNQPVFSMTPTASGKGYWLVARDGGVFAFGDAHFYGSAGHLRLASRHRHHAAARAGTGYRMVAADGGIFSFGDAPYYGSLPGIGIHVSDVVGMAPTPDNKGYWIVRRDGATYAFGNAHYFGNYTTFACDHVTGIFSNPKAQGYRLVAETGATIPFGTAPGGSSDHRFAATRARRKPRASRR